VEAGILTGATPAFTSMLAFFFLKERLSATAATGIVGTVLGIVYFRESTFYPRNFLSSIF
jgi:drug/metabolite transporter (DMT)-like permease